MTGQQTINHDSGTKDLKTLAGKGAWQTVMTGIVIATILMRL